MPSAILARADALMRRLRKDVSEIDEVPLLTDAIDLDDIPLLLDAEPPVAESANRSANEPVAQAGSNPALEGALIDIVAHELTRRVSERLTAELPHIIESTVRDLLADPEMMALIKHRE